MADNEFVRVKGPTMVYTTTRELAKADGLEIIKGDALYTAGPMKGLPVEPKPLDSLGNTVAKNTETKGA